MDGSVGPFSVSVEGEGSFGHRNFQFVYDGGSKRDKIRRLWRFSVTQGTFVLPYRLRSFSYCGRNDLSSWSFSHFETCRRKMKSFLSLEVESLLPSHSQSPSPPVV